MDVGRAKESLRRDGAAVLRDVFHADALAVLARGAPMTGDLFPVLYERRRRSST